MFPGLLGLGSSDDLHSNFDQIASVLNVSSVAVSK